MREEFMHKVDPSFTPDKHTGLSTPLSTQDDPPLGRRLTFSPKASLSQNETRGAARWIAAEGNDKLKARLMSHALPETVVTELIKHHTPIVYPKGSIIFLQGA